MKRFNTIFLLIFVLSAMPLTTLAADLPAADYVEPNTGMEFMEIPGGNYVMGDDTDRFAKPAHAVTIQPFLFGRYEVTFDQYGLFCKATGRAVPTDQGWGMETRPVINVSWQDAVAFTEWLSKKTGRTFRLPSESEWEYAARAEASTIYPWGDGLGENMANCRDCESPWSGKTTAPVGSFSPNGFGLFDMNGNVYEWTLDAKSGSYEGAPVDGSARTAEGPVDRITRGGSWMRVSKHITASTRCWDRQDRQLSEVGFRVVLEP